MRIARKFASLAAGTALVAGSLLVAAPAASADGTTGGQKVIDALSAGYGDGSNGNPYDFQIVTTAVVATGLAPTLASLDGITVFAPNDRAFEVLANKRGLLGPNYRYGATVDEDKVVAALQKLPNWQETVKAIVLYHVFTGGAVDGAAATALPVFGTKLKMANGQNLGVTNFTRFTGTPTLILGDKDGSFFNDFVVKSKVDVIKVDGAVVHGISDVLLPTL